jgi:suppressor for copper-sensitivity B
MAMMLGLAVLGGLILNLMPCVLPVLSIKLLSVIGHGGGERRAVRQGFLASAAGIMVAFLALASVLAALKAAGTTVGWGMQFQHSWFLVAMTAMITLFAANLWGFLEIPLPQVLADAFGHRGETPGLAGHFFSGAFATLLATPCSAPFLGTAVGFALARGPAEIVAVFAALGLGLALPYLAVAAFPAMATRLPHPGPWVVTLRRILGFVLAATAVWLLTVIDAQVGPKAAGAVAGTMVLLLVVLFLARRRGPGRRRLATSVVAGLALVAIGMPTWLGGANGDSARRSLGGVWQRFDEPAIARLVAEGRTVFVDVTADWCVTCQVNKAAVLERGVVYDRLSASELVAMQADWTRPDAAIASYLARFGRYGIPFNVVYGPQAPQGIPLPELLTASDVVAALDKAGTTVSATAAR